eukprot:356082-Chlamydomonas_euryale.AAC.3
MCIDPFHMPYTCNLQKQSATTGVHMQGIHARQLVRHARQLVQDGSFCCVRAYAAVHARNVSQPCSCACPQRLAAMQLCMPAMSRSHAAMHPRNVSQPCSDACPTALQQAHACIRQQHAAGTRMRQAHACSRHLRAAPADVHADVHAEWPPAAMHAA